MFGRYPKPQINPCRYVCGGGCARFGSLGGYDGRACDGSRRLGPLRGSIPLLHNHHEVPGRWTSSAFGAGEKPLFLLSRAHPPAGAVPQRVIKDRPDKCQQSGEDDNDCMTSLRIWIARSRTEAISSRLERFNNPRTMLSRVTSSPPVQRSFSAERLESGRLVPVWEPAARCHLPRLMRTNHKQLRLGIREPAGFGRR
jgi:hypothetical protein